MSFGSIRICLPKRGSHFLQTDPVVRERIGIQIHANCRLCASADADLTYAIDLRQFLTEYGVAQVVEATSWNGVRGNGEVPDVRIGGLHPAVSRQAREIGGQLSRRRIALCLDGSGGPIGVPFAIKPYCHTPFT